MKLEKSLEEKLSKQFNLVTTEKFTPEQVLIVDEAYRNITLIVAQEIQTAVEKERDEAVLDYIMSLGWQDTDNPYVKEVLEDANKLAEIVYKDGLSLNTPKDTK